MPSPDRTFARLLTCICAAGGALLLVGAIMAFFGGPTSMSRLRTHWCVVAPATALDWALHSPAFGAWLLVLLPVLVALWTAKRERAMSVELRSATQAARLRSLPDRVSVTAHTVGVVESLDLVDAPRPFAFVYGWLNPRICVSTGLVTRLTERELEAVLRHEQWHLARRDPARLLIVRMLSAAFIFLPGIRRLSRQYRLATEIAADQYVVATMGNRRWLVSAIAKLVLTESPTGVVAFLGLADARIAALAGDLPVDANRPQRVAGFMLLGELTLISILVMQSGSGLSIGVWLNPFC